MKNQKNAIIEGIEGQLSPANILSNLFKIKKQSQTKLSLTVLAKVIGISSKSNLSEFFMGKRTLSKKYWKPLVKFLVDDLNQQEYLLKRLEYQREKKLNIKDNIWQEVLQLQKILLNRTKDSIKFLTPFQMEVFTAFGLYPSASEKDIYDVFPKKNQIEIDRSITKLLALGFLKDVGDGKYTFESSNLSFPRMGSDEAKKYIQKCILYAHDKLNCRVGDERYRYFDSIFVSVESEKFKQKLEELRRYVKRFVADIESIKGDSIIRLNIQSFLL